MPVTPEQVVKVASLARLDPTAGLAPQEAEAALAALAGQLDAVVEYMDILNQADTSTVEPLYQPLGPIAPPRKDEARPAPGPDAILREAPSRQGDFFAVPPVIS